MDTFKILMTAAAIFVAAEAAIIVPLPHATEPLGIEGQHYDMSTV